MNIVYWFLATTALIVSTFAQTPNGTRKAWNDTLWIDRDGTYQLVGDYISTQNQSTLQFKDTTALKAASFDSVGFVVNLKQLSSANTIGGGSMVYFDSTDLKALTGSAVPDGGTIFSSPTTDRVWVRQEYLTRRIVSAAWYGTDGAAIESALTKAQNSNFADVTLVIPDLPKKGRWVFSDGITFASTERQLLIEGGSNTILKIASNDTIFKVIGTGGNIRISNLIFHGNGKSNAGGTGIYIDGTLGDVSISNCKFDTLAIGIGSEDLTSFLSVENYFRQCKTAIKAGYNSDGHLYLRNDAQRCDTFFTARATAGGENMDGMMFMQCVLGYDSVAYNYDAGSGGLQILGGYWEGVRHPGTIGSGSGSNKNIVIDGLTIQTQNVQQSGFLFKDNDLITIANTKASGSIKAGQNMMVVEGASASFTSFNNAIIDSVKFVNSAFTYQLNHNFTRNKRQIHLYDANALGTNPYFDIRTYNTTGKEIFSVRRTGAANNTNVYKWAIRDSVGVLFLGTHQQSYWELGGSANAPTAARSGIQGDLYFQDASNIDNLWVGTRHAGKYRWYSLTRDRFLNDPIMEGKANFTTTDLVDALPLPNVHPDSFIVSVTAINSSPTDSTIDLSVNVVPDTVYVYRPTGIPSGMGYYWVLRRIKNK